MRPLKNILPEIVFCLVWGVLFVFGVSFTQASTSSVSATIRMSVCGDGVVEYPEDCEGTDLNGGTCENQGYSGGELLCDVACSYDTAGCTPTPAPTLVPTPITTPTSVPTTASTSTPSSSDNTTTTSISTTATITNVVEELVKIVKNTVESSSLVFIRSNFDQNGDGKITSSEVYEVVKTWVEVWREEAVKLAEVGIAKVETEEKVLKCDIDKDGRCGLVDFSILLSYVED